MSLSSYDMEVKRERESVTSSSPDRSTHREGGGEEDRASSHAGSSSSENCNREVLIGLVERFRKIGVDQDISLPQLVLVGNQDSAKSKLLRGLTGLPIPFENPIFARFVTRLVFEPKRDTSVALSIKPGKLASKKEKERLEGFGHRLSANSLTSKTFRPIVDEIAECLRLPAAGMAEPENFGELFRDDVLEIVISGPGYPHLCLIDVPLFQNLPGYHTKEHDALNDALVGQYIDGTRSIILAVMDARNKFADQEVLHAICEHDPEGTRTVGIVTNCDLVPVRDELKVLEIVQNETIRLSHGWFALMSEPSSKLPREDKMSTRESPWTRHPKARIGTSSLIEFLNDILFDHIRNELPRMAESAESLIERARNDIEDSKSPSLIHDARVQLIQLAGTYQSKAANALDGLYPTKMSPDDPQKLRMHLRDLTDQFVANMRQGHLKTFDCFDEENSLGVQESTDCDRSSCYEDSSDGDTCSRESIYDWIWRIHRDVRGSELPGVTSPSLLQKLFRLQSRNWKWIAKEYVTHAVKILRHYNVAVFVELIEEEELRLSVLTYLEQHFQKAKLRAFAELENLIWDERNGVLQTESSAYVRNLERIRKERFKIRAQDKDGRRQYSPVEPQPNEIPPGIAVHTAEDAHDILKSYYEVALMRFVDNVTRQTVERHILGAEGVASRRCSRRQREPTQQVKRLKGVRDAIQSII